MNSPMDQSDISQELIQCLAKLQNEIGFSKWGITPLLPAMSLDKYKNWIQLGLHADMSYLEKHLPIKENPQLHFAQAQSAFVFAFPYLPHPEPLPDSELRIAAYAKGKDYHRWIVDKLMKIIPILKREYPNATFAPMTDSKPILERDLAYRAGLGWFGKNTCLIEPKQGSFFLIGEILSTQKLQGFSSKTPDFCGNCTACIDICPTQALTEHKLDANRCISYWTIESKKVPPLELRSHFGDWFFGCDLCQTICPWNQKKFNKMLKTELLLETVNRTTLVAELNFILTSSHKKIQKFYLEQNSPLLRAGALGLKRNAILVCANRGINELLPQIEALIQNQRLSELASWACKILRA